MWSLLGALADIRALLLLMFQSGPDNPPPPAGSLHPYVTVGQYSPPRDTGQRPDRRTGWGRGSFPLLPIPTAWLCPGLCMHKGVLLTYIAFFLTSLTSSTCEAKHSNEEFSNLHKCLSKRERPVTTMMATSWSGTPMIGRECEHTLYFEC